MPDVLDGSIVDFRALFDASPTPFLVVRPPDWVIVAANDSRLEITGTTRAEQIGRRLFDVFPDDPDDPEADGVRNLTASLQRVVATHMADTMAVQRYAVRGPAGVFVERWWSPVNTPVLDQEGRVSLIIHRVEDVTEVIRLRGDAQGRIEHARGQQLLIDRLRGTSTALRESEARRATALSIARLGTFEWEPSTGEVVLDERAREMFGFDADEAITATEVFGRVHPEDLPGIEAAAMSAAAEGGHLEMDCRLLLPDGANRIVTSLSGPVLGVDGKTQRIAGVFADVTARKADETRLRELNEHLEQEVEKQVAERNLFGTLVETTDVIILAADFDYNLLAINKAAADEFERIYGMRPKVGDNMLDLLADQPEHQAQIREGWGRGLAGEETTFVEEFGDPDRGRPYYEIRFRTLRNEAGKPIGAYQFVSDVTERLREQALLAEAQEQLRQAQKMEAVGQLTGGLAHDFNNLLTGMMGNMELLQMRLSQGKLQDIERFIVAAQGAGRRAASLTQRLLAFSRRQTLDPKPTDANRLIAGMEELLRRTVGPENTIEVVGAAGLWTANIDAGQLENALLNLCINGRDAMPDGGRLTIETANKWLDERAGRERELPPGQYLSVCVTDTGTGMTPEVIERVFEPFFTTKPLGEGTGLGLSMIYGFARQSNGQVRIYSEVGVGTTICIYLPRYVGEATLAGEEEAVAAAAAATGPCSWSTTKRRSAT